MANPKRASSYALAGFLVALFGIWLTSVQYVAAVTPGGLINFFDVSGSGSSSACTSTAWNGGTFSDGNQGFGGNLGTAQQIPIVASGEKICIQIVFTDQSASTSYTISDPGSFLTLVKGTNPFSTDASGNANVYLIFSVSGLTGDCTTHPIDVSPDISGGAGSGGQIHHYYGGSGSCGGTSPPVGVPQFPLGSIGFASLMAMGITAMLLLKRKQFSF
jgi:hypothetical protein